MCELVRYGRVHVNWWSPRTAPSSRKYLRLQLSSGPDTAEWLKETNEGKRGKLRREHAQVEGNSTLRKIHDVRRKEWMRDPVAGAGNDHVVLVVSTVSKMNCMTV